MVEVKGRYYRYVLGDTVNLGSNVFGGLSSLSISLKDLLGTKLYNSYMKDKTKSDFYLRFIDNNSKLRYSLAVVENENSKIINFCGLSIDVDTLDVVLGIYPGREYISIFSFKSVINYFLFKNCSSSKLSDDDVVFLLECIKLLGVEDNILDTIKEMSKDVYVDSLPEFDSVIVNFVKRNLFRNKLVEDDKDLSNLFKYTSDEKFLIELISFCIDVSSKLDTFSARMFKNFIVEESVEDVVGNSHISTSTLTSSGSNYKVLELLRLRYLNSGVYSLVIDSLISYGFGYNKRKSLYKEYNSLSNSEVSRYHRDMLVLLSSMSYVDFYTAGSILLDSDNTKSICYNIIDVIRAVGWEQDLVFSYDISKEFKSDVLINYIFNHFDITDILSKLGVSESTFIAYIGDYSSRYLYLVNCGSMYSRSVKKSQKCLSVFCRPMLINSGKIFERVSRKIFSKL